MEKVLPKGWVETELGNILKLKNGYAFKSNDFKEEGIPVIRISNIQNEQVKTETAARIDLSKIKNDFIIKRGDILIAMSGATTGKYGIYHEDFVALQNQRVGNLIPYDKNLTSNKFIFYLLGGLKKEIEEKAYGGAQPNISPTLIEEIKIGLPPLPEQQRIVAKLDTLFGQLDKIKTHLERIPQLLKDFRQSVLTQAVTGKLTEEWREGRELEDGAELINNITKERLNQYDKELLVSKKSGGKKTKRPTNLDNKIIPLDEVYKSWNLPKEWSIVPLAFCSANSQDSIVDGPFGSSINVNEDYIEEGIPVVRMINIRPFKYVPDNLKFIRIEKFLTLRRHNIIPKDVLIAKVGATIGDCCIYPDNQSEGMLSTTGSCRLRVDSKFFDNKFIELFICQQKNVLKSIASQTAQPFLNMKVIKAFPCIVMSKQEQQEIVHRVESLFAKADKIETQYQTLKEKIEQLPQAILAKAFRGELVERLPTDGDARELLEEIKKAKAELSKTTKPKRGKTSMIKSVKLNIAAEPKAKYGK